MEAVAQAQPNIALVKYWGKQRNSLNVPATPSLSVTLDTLWTRSTVRFSENIDHDRLSINAASNAGQLRRVTACMDELRRITGTPYYADVSSTNNFPTGAGLASSASGFAALVTAACAALGADLDAQERSRLARKSSASAARSIFGGFVELPVEDPDPTARTLLAETAWPLDVCVAITSTQPKQIGSTAGMIQSADNSVFYNSWVASAADDFNAARQAVLNRDFQRVANISEASCLKMHAVMWSTRPPLMYWNGATVEIIHRVRDLRAGGVPAFFTIDAGPQVKIVSLPGYRSKIEQAVQDVPGVAETVHSPLGGDARLIQP